jgi:DNA-binding beta-propeller fold protein YncE
MSLRVALFLSYALASAAAPLYALDKSWPAPHPAYNISQVTAVAVLGREVHVAQRGTDCAPIVVFAAGGGAALRSWGSKALTSVHGLSTGAAGSGTLWATDILQGTVKEFDGASGSLLRTAGTAGAHGPGLKPPQFSAPADVAATRDLVVVSDGDGGSNNRVLALAASDLSVTWAAGGPADNGTKPGAFSSPHSVAYDSAADALLVADRGNTRVQLFAAATGAFLGQWSAGPCFAAPWGIRVDAARSIMFVADGAAGVLSVVSYTGAAAAAAAAARAGAAPPTALPCTLIQSFDVGVPEKPHELAFDDATRDLYLAGVGAPPTIQRYVLA